MNKFHPFHRLGASVSKPPLKAPLDFRSGPPKPPQWTTNFLKQSQLSRGHASLSAALPKWLPKPSTGARLGEKKPFRGADFPTATKGIRVAIKTQNRIAAHQHNVNDMLTKSFKAVKAPSLRSTFPSAGKPMAEVHRHLAQSITHSRAVQASVKAGTAHLKRYEQAVERGQSTAWKSASSALFKDQGRLHRTQATLLDRVGKALSNLFRPKPPRADQKLHGVGFTGDKSHSRSRTTKASEPLRGDRPRKQDHAIKDPRPEQRGARPGGLTSDAQARRLFQAGLRRYEAGDFAGARETWNIALDMAGPGERPELLYNIALTHLRQGNAVRVEEIAFELMRDGHTELVGRLQQIRAGGTAASNRLPIVGLNEQARRLFQAGERRYDAGDYNGARRDWNAALGVAGPAERPRLQYDIALTHLHQGNAVRVEEIAAELIQGGHAELARQLRSRMATREPGGPQAGVHTRGPEPAAPRRGRGTRPQSARGPEDGAEPALFVRGPNGMPRLEPVRVNSATHVAATSTFVIQFNQGLSLDQVREYLWPSGAPLGAGFVAAAADPMAPESGSTSIYHAQIQGPGWRGLRPSVHQRLDTLVPGTASVLERRLGSVDEAVRNRILAFEDRATPGSPLAEAWPPASPRYVYYFDGSLLEVYTFQPPGADAERFAREAFEMLRRDMVFLVTQRQMRVRDAWSFLVRSHREQLVMVISAYVYALAGAQGPGRAPSLGRTLRPRAPRSLRGPEDIGNAPTVPAGRTREALEDARTVPAPAPSSRPGTRGRSRQTPRTGASRATSASFDEVQRALQKHPENVSLNSTPVAGAPVNATHQQRWELFGGEGPAPPYFRAGDQYHVDRVFAEQAGDVEAALYQRLADGWGRMRAAADRARLPISASWREVQDLLGTKPHAVHTSESRAFHQMTWEGAGGTGPAPPIFRFGEDHLHVNVDSLSAGQSGELRSLLP